MTDPITIPESSDVRALLIAILRTTGPVEISDEALGEAETDDEQGEVELVVTRTEAGCRHEVRPSPPAPAAELTEAQRCPSCDHLTAGHQEEGCWYVVTDPEVTDPMCPCTVPHGKQGGEQAEGGR